MNVLVMAKAPVAGRVKTRLCPPCDPNQAAEIAAAALADTLDAVVRCGASRRIVALDGEPGDWLPPGVEVINQRGDTFGDRLGAAWDDVGGPTLQIGMDTPQVTAELLDACLAALAAPAVDAVLGPARDGGWWALGMIAADRRVFHDVAMSRPDTGEQQLRRLRCLDLTVAPLPTLTDLDDVMSAREVAAELPPSSRTAAVLRPLLDGGPW